MLYRLETMVLMAIDLPLQAIRRQIASGIDIIIHLGRLRDHTRKVLEISEIIGYEDGDIITKPIYEFIEQETGKTEKVYGDLVKTGELMHREKQITAGV